MTATREDVVRVARTQIDVPFHHMERQLGVALDCAGLLIVVGRELDLVPPGFNVPAYTMNPDGRLLIEWCDEHMGTKLTQATMQPGDVVVMRTSRLPQHLGIIGDHPYGDGILSIIHASNRIRPARVIEHRLEFTRIQTFVAAYAMPGLG